MVHRYDFDSAHEAFTFSAYQDVLRLGDHTFLQRRYDNKTVLRFRDYWWLRQWEAAPRRG